MTPAEAGLRTEAGVMAFQKVIGVIQTGVYDDFTHRGFLEWVRRTPTIPGVVKALPENLLNPLFFHKWLVQAGLSQADATWAFAGWARWAKKDEKWPPFNPDTVGLSRPSLAKRLLADYWWVLALAGSAGAGYWWWKRQKG